MVTEDTFFEAHRNHLDVHVPKLQTDGPSPLRKIVVKVPVAPLPPPDERVLAAAAQEGSALGTLLGL